MGGIVAIGVDHPIVEEGTRAGDDGVVSAIRDRLQYGRLDCKKVTVGLEQSSG